MLAFQTRLASRIIAGIAGQQRLPTEPTSEPLDGRLAPGGAIAAFERRRFHVSFLLETGKPSLSEICETSLTIRRISDRVSIS
ncbi:MAG TPA: hypothetical protein VGH47_01750, partial [Xanthobacteraceae bacterium]